MALLYGNLYGNGFTLRKSGIFVDQLSFLLPPGQRPESRQLPSFPFFLPSSSSQYISHSCHFCLQGPSPNWPTSPLSSICTWSSSLHDWSCLRAFALAVPSLRVLFPSCDNFIYFLCFKKMYVTAVSSKKAMTMSTLITAVPPAPSAVPGPQGTQ